MPISLPLVSVKQFANEFSPAFQASRELMGTTLEIHGVVGDSFQWPKIGQAVMIDRGASQSLIPASDVPFEPITTAFRDLVLNLPTDIFDQSNVNIDVRSELARDHAEAAGRRSDQFILDALEKAKTGPIDKRPFIISADNKNLTVKKLREARRILGKNNVLGKNSRVFGVTHFNNMDGLLAETEVTSSDFNTVRTLVDGDIKSYLGFQYITLGDRPEGGLIVKNNVRTVYIYSARAIGVAFSLDPATNVEWSPERQSWLSISRLRAGASVLRPEGIVAIECDESAFI